MSIIDKLFEIIRDGEHKYQLEAIRIMIDLTKTYDMDFLCEPSEKTPDPLSAALNRTVAEPEPETKRSRGKSTAA